MADLAKKFGVPASLVDYIKKIQTEETEYQAKVKALMAKKGIKSLGDLTPDEKKKFFSQLDAMHQAKNEAVTDYNPKSQGGTRKELLAKFAETGNSKDAEAARKAGATQDELKKAAANAMKRGQGEKGKNYLLSKNEEVEIEEAKSSTGYQLYHKDFSSAMAHAYDFAKQKYGMEIDPMEIDRNVAMGPKKPSSGKANSYRLLDKTGKKAIQVQVTNLDNKRYELNMYKEDIDEASSPAQQAAIAIAMKKAGKKPKDMEEAVGGGTSVNTQSLKSAAAQKKRADVAVKIAALRLKQQKERETLQKQKSSVKEEVMEVVEVEINEADKVPEYKTGGEPLAKKFEKAFAKMGIKTKIKMKTVGNVSVNEAAMKKVLSANKKKKMKEQEEVSSKKDNVKSGDALSGKREPIEINPKIENKK